MGDLARIAISPCPNDTFAFYALIANAAYKIEFHDIEELNRALLAGQYAFAKGSFAICEAISESYTILPVGAAIGKGVGPVLVGAMKSHARVALPGKNTTAHRLFLFWLERQQPLDIQTVQMPFYEMLPALKSGRVDAAVLIHEGRFVYRAAGLALVVDLGAYWEETTGAMIPLGCIYARKDLADAEKDTFVTRLHDSLQASRSAYAQKSALYKNEILPYMKSRAQEKDDSVVEAHVDTYVTEDTLAIGPAARESIAVFRRECLGDKILQPDLPKSV